jgi:mono/diheme cytochrome c family protein
MFSKLLKLATLAWVVTPLVATSSGVVAQTVAAPTVVAQATPAPAATSTPPSAAAKAGGTALYTVTDGYKVDAQTMKGFRAWRAAACDRCHGANQEGMVGPSLLASMKVLTKEEFVTTVRDGRLLKGMQSFGNSPQVMDNMDQLYAYLKGRSDGAITRAKVEPMP